MEQKKINLNQIARNIAGQTDYSYDEVKSFLQIILDQFKTYLKAHDHIELRGFGSFYVKEHKGRYVKLKTKIIESKNHFVTSFKPGKKMKRIVNE